MAGMQKQAVTKLNGTGLWTNEEGVEVKNGIYIFELYAGGFGARRAMIVGR